MNFLYGEWDGTPFDGPGEGEAGALFAQLADYILAYGDKALEALQKTRPENAELLQQLIDAGFLQQAAGKIRLTPRAVTGMQLRAMDEVFRDLRAGRREGHDTVHGGRGSIRTDGTRRYSYGDPTSEIDTGASLRNAVQRAGAGTPVRLRESDLEVHHTESPASCSTVLMLDQSGSMMRWGRFLNAKKVALGMQALIRRRFPMDTLDCVGFWSIAEPIAEADLALAAPKPVSISDWEVDRSFPLADVLARRAAGKPSGIPEHFTNLQMGLAMARRILQRRAGDNRQIFIITDGQPTAHVEGGTLRLLYPPDERTMAITLREAVACVQQDIRFATFALTEDYHDMGWLGFVDQLTRLVKGTAFYCAAPDLGSAVMESYLGGVRRKKYIA